MRAITLRDVCNSKQFFVGVTFMGMVISFGGLALADAPIVYPKNGQTMEQQSADAGVCRNWATQQTGVNPAYLEGQLSMARSQSPAAPQMPVARGALRGVAAGAALGAVSENTDPGTERGAAVGVTAGAMRGMAQRVDRAREAKAQEAQQQVQNLENQYATYNRAFSACMSGKGYSVN